MNKFQERSNERRVDDSSLYIAAGDRNERHALISTDGVSASFWNSEDHNAIESKNSTRLILTPENRADVLFGVKQNGVSTYYRLLGEHSSSFSFPGSLLLTNTTDAVGTEERNCALKIGNPNGLHLEFDGYEIMAKTDGTTPGILYLNHDGGDVRVNRYNVLTQNPVSGDNGEWKTLAPNSTNFVDYVSGEDIAYRRFGAVVQVVGEVKPKSTSIAINSSDSILVCTLPSGYRPIRRLRYICHGSGNNKFMLSIETNGSVYINRYGTTTGYASSVTGNEWLPFNSTFLTGGTIT